MKNLIYILLFIIFSSSAFAQGGLFSMQYSMGFATGDLHDHIQKASFRGFTMDYRKFVNPNVGVGFDIGWNVFYEEKPYDTYEYENLTYSGKQYRYDNCFPMLLAASYYLKPDQLVNPYVGVGLGTMYTLRNTDMNMYTFEVDSWQFALRPELGIIIEPNPGVGILIGSKYYYGFETGDLKGQGYFTLNVGIVLKQ
ncbi:MAG: outer membrane beta-barrel protein [Bacteroidales bacterium]